MPAPIAFVVMPFERKPTDTVKPDVPATVDFDAVWEHIVRCSATRAFGPYVRANADVAAVSVAPQSKRRQRALEVLAEHGHKPVVRQTVVLTRLLSKFAAQRQLSAQPLAKRLEPGLDSP